MFFSQIVDWWQSASAVLRVPEEPRHQLPPPPLQVPILPHYRCQPVLGGNHFSERKFLKK